MICSNGVEMPILDCVVMEDEAGHEQAKGRRDATVGACGDSAKRSRNENDEIGVGIRVREWRRRS